MLLQDAYEEAQRYLDNVIRPDHAVEIVVASCREIDEGWVFGYNTRPFLEDGDIASSLVGNSPVVVPRSGESVHLAPLGSLG